MQTVTMSSVAGLILTAGVFVTSCAEPQGPYPTVTLSIEGMVTVAESAAAPIAGATVQLWKAQINNAINLAGTHTDAYGRYSLTYSFTSVCPPTANTTDFLTASADGYDLQSTYDYVDFSTPVIYCTTATQVINLSLRPRPLN
jgi:hypothetical protein